ERAAAEIAVDADGGEAIRLKRLLYLLGDRALGAEIKRGGQRFVRRRRCRLRLAALQERVAVGFLLEAHREIAEARPHAHVLDVEVLALREAAYDLAAEAREERLARAFRKCGVQIVAGKGDEHVVVLIEVEIVLGAPVR